MKTRALWGTGLRHASDVAHVATLMYVVVWHSCCPPSIVPLCNVVFDLCVHGIYHFPEL